MWKIATTSLSVFRNLDCLSLVVCSNATSDRVVFIFFQILRFEIGGAAYLWMRLIHGRLPYFSYTRLGDWSIVCRGFSGHLVCGIC